MEIGRKITRSAIKFDNFIWTGKAFDENWTKELAISGEENDYDHASIFRRNEIPDGCIVGFLDNQGEFHDREKSGKIAFIAGQVVFPTDKISEINCLISEMFCV